MTFNIFWEYKKTSNLITITINRRFSNRDGPWSVLCRCHSPRPRYHNTTDWLQYANNLVALSNVQIPTEKQYHSQRSDLSSNCSRVQCSNNVPLFWSTRVYKGRCPDNDNINKHSVALQTWTLHQSSNISWLYVVKLETYLIYIDQLELDQFMKIIKMFRVEIPPPEK